LAHLENHFSKMPLPYSHEDFQAELHSFIETLTGYKLTNNEDLFVPQYDNYGMSGGMISCGFWLEHGIPLLLSRLDEMNKAYGNS